MFGFVIGALSLYGLIKVLRWGRGGACGGGWRGHHRYQGHGWHGHAGWHDGGHGWHRGWQRDEGFRDGGDSRWPSFALRGLFSRLDTTPGQEKVIRAAAHEIFGAMAPLRGELDDSRRDIAQAVRTGTVDEVAMGELFARHDEKLREARKTFIGALAKVNEVLDEDQRKRLADLLDRGGHFESFGGPYRQGGGWGRGN